MLKDKIEAACRNWGRTMAQDLKASLEKALKDGQPKRNQSQEASLNFNDVVTVTDSTANIKIIATDDYWINIEEGRAAGKKRPPSDAVGKKWQNKNNIDPRKILKEIEINYKKKNGLSTQKRTLSKPKKTLSYDEAAKRLSFIFAGVISKRGIEPKPFVDRVVTTERIKQLTDKLSSIMGEEMKAELNINNEFKNIKLSV